MLIIQRSQARQARSFCSLFCLTFLLAIASLSCVKQPRRFLLASDKTRPVSQDKGAADASFININTASAEELEKLPGIGKGLSARIIAYRKVYGRFRRPEHLMMVRGISARRFRAMQALITAE
jgi:competence ComEA-like helix-hairpin-helix protein